MKDFTRAGVHWHVLLPWGACSRFLPHSRPFMFLISFISARCLFCLADCACASVWSLSCHSCQCLPARAEASKRHAGLEPRPTQFCDTPLAFEMYHRRRCESCDALLALMPGAPCAGGRFCFVVGCTGSSAGTVLILRVSSTTGTLLDN